jgi:hypothetical protein
MSQPKRAEKARAMRAEKTIITQVGQVAFRGRGVIFSAGTSLLKPQEAGKGYVYC